ncbi:MAG TPA: divalent-cation tolerance protein CutA [Dehalococcoidales bacterium]|nr:divalent-cation tolerance protein CutA [Dehalococcoidales bacterium]
MAKAKAQPPTYAVVFVTARDAEEAEKISKALVKRRLAACVNTIPQVNTHFWWKDKLEHQKESFLIIKTKESLVPEIVKAVKKLHSYSVPEIIALPIIGGDEAYLDWIENEVV